MWTGTLIAESLRVGARVDVPFLVTGVERVAPDNLSPDQLARDIPKRWTLLYLEVDDGGPLAEALADVLDEFGWYADLRSDRETIVVFPGRVFRYARGDAAGREAAVSHGRALGVPDAQLDWP